MITLKLEYGKIFGQDGIGICVSAEDDELEHIRFPDDLNCLSFTYPFLEKLSEDEIVLFLYAIESNFNEISEKLYLRWQERFINNFYHSTLDKINNRR